MQPTPCLSLTSSAHPACLHPAAFFPHFSVQSQDILSRKVPGLVQPPAGPRVAVGCSGTPAVVPCASTNPGTHRDQDTAPPTSLEMWLSPFCISYLVEKSLRWAPPRVLCSQNRTDPESHLVVPRAPPSRVPNVWAGFTSGLWRPL